MNWVKLFLTSSCLLISQTPPFPSREGGLGLPYQNSMGFVLAQNDGKHDGGNDSGGSRGDCSAVAQTSNNLPLKALVHPEKWLTATDSPTFWVYVPYSTTSTLSARLSVRSEEDEKVIPVTLSGIPGIIKLPLPKTLEHGKKYHWFLTILCNKKDESANPVVDGWVQQVEPNSSLMNQLKTRSSLEQASLYDKAGYWYDALTILAEQRLLDSNNSQAVNAWNDLLQSVQLEAIGKQPIVSCCTLP